MNTENEDVKCIKMTVCAFCDILKINVGDRINNDKLEQLLCNISFNMDLFNDIIIDDFFNLINTLGFAFDVNVINCKFSMDIYKNSKYMISFMYRILKYNDVYNISGPDLNNYDPNDETIKIFTIAKNFIRLAPSSNLKQYCYERKYTDLFELLRQDDPTVQIYEYNNKLYNAYDIAVHPASCKYIYIDKTSNVYNKDFNDKTRKMIIHATNLWKPYTNCYWPYSFRKTAKFLMFISKYTIVNLDKFIWFNIIEFLGRNDFSTYNNLKHYCRYCGKEAELKCSKCRKHTFLSVAYYCSIRCQRKSWPNHKKMHNLYEKMLNTTYETVDTKYYKEFMEPSPP